MPTRGLRDEVDRARWQVSSRRMKRIARKALGTSRFFGVIGAEPGDPDGNVLVVYFHPKEGGGVQCQRVDRLRRVPIGEPIIFEPVGAWVAHMREAQWMRDWPELGEAWGRLGVPG